MTTEGLSVAGQKEAIIPVRLRTPAKGILEYRLIDTTQNSLWINQRIRKSRQRGFRKYHHNLLRLSHILAILYKLQKILTP